MSSETQLNSVLERNIAALRQRQMDDHESRNLTERVTDRISIFVGSMSFIYLTAAIVGLWVLVNIGGIRILPRFDPTFAILATSVSVEAIFLSTFILITQNRAARTAHRRAELDVHIGLLTEHEVTHLIQITTAIATHLGLEIPKEVEVEELKADVAPDRVLDKLEASESG